MAREEIELSVKVPPGAKWEYVSLGICQVFVSNVFCFVLFVRA